LFCQKLLTLAQLFDFFFLRFNLDKAFHRICQMKHESYIPCDILKPFVKTFSIHESTEENTYKVLPDTGVVMGFQYKGRLSRLAQDKETPLSISGVSGLTDQFKIFKNTAHTGTVLVTFMEAGAAPFFKQPIHEIFRESISLDNFLLCSELLLVEERLSEAKTDQARVEVVEQFLISRLRTREPDKLVLAALALIHKSKGTIRIGELLEQLYMSQSSLERRFRQEVGTSPKKFASIVRLKNTLAIYQPGNSFTELGYEAGFYDQAHFIKEFKAFTGDTPESFFGGQ
jgi:AraC-like DNA-binding protein